MCYKAHTFPFFIKSKMNCIISNCGKNILFNSKCILSARILVRRNNYATIIGEEKQIQVGNGTINYIKVGNGKNKLLCFPGALGTIWSDFKPQITQLNQENFTIVAFDPPGYGHSRPPNRIFSLDFYEKDAIVAHQLMKELGYDKFSLLGWSDGGISSIILAAKFPKSVYKLVIWGANSYILPEDIKAYESIRNISKWSDKAKTPLIKLYGEEGLQNMWSGWCDAMQALQKKGGNICMDSVSKVICPTLILHGAKDPVVLAEHPNYINANIRNSRLHVFPQGKHNIHLRYAEEFNKIVSEFILES